jgi:integrase
MREPDRFQYPVTVGRSCLPIPWRELGPKSSECPSRELGKFQAPKTRKALRTIPLGRHAVAAIKSHRERVSRRAHADLVFGNRNGDPMRESKLLTNVLQPAAEAAGLGRVTWHQFRHIHSSLRSRAQVALVRSLPVLAGRGVSDSVN